MKRFADDRLKKWIVSPRRKPILLRGARQVGKSTLVHNFAKSHNLVLNEINLERRKDLASTFATLNPSIICERLSAIFGRDVKAENSILFIDEIQAVPEAIASLRYFYEEMPELPVLAAGSLLEFALAKHSFSMPVGRIEYLHLGPMDFREFAEEINPYLASCLDMEMIQSEKGALIHNEMMRLLRTYLFVGGMPECVLAYAETKSLQEAAAVQEQILGTYIDDFAKYANGRDLAGMQAIFRKLPINNARKVKYVNFDRDMKSRDVKSALDLFAKAKIISQVFNTDANGVPFGAEEDRDVWKPIFLDVGLMNHANGLRESFFSEVSDTDLVNEGVMAEQFVGQQLLYRKGTGELPSLHYWLREGAKNNAEVDYVVEDGMNVLPVEVKSGKSGSLRALREMMICKGLKRAVRFDANVASVQKIALGEVDYELINLPLYSCVVFDRAAK